MPARSKSSPAIEAHMRRALKLAAKGQGRVEPNPMVGCVIARGEKVLGEGYHKQFGGPHAEAEALAACEKAGHDPAGADVYVTLEPCSHFGKTPPCADALIEAKVGRVIAAMVDPFPQVDGAGAARIKKAKIPVDIGLCETEARELNQPFLKRLKLGVPWVIVKWAQTIDGYIATRTGDSKWISSDKSRAIAHEVRARVDAILVGISTILKDDPMLTARDVEVRRQARRVVIDPTLKISVDHQLVRSIHRKNGPPVTLGARAEIIEARPRRLAELEERGVEVVALPVKEVEKGRFALRPLLKYLVSRHDATNVMVEGGGTVIGSLFAEELVDEAMVFVGPKLLGDTEAIAPATGLTVRRMQSATKLRLNEVQRVEEDVLLRYRCGDAY
jgi:diaminohydroxyphosphoribosylaminopyrimidine deaminase/5-amino-6-(5-phosphoribosylamino)uracil reductase